MQATAKQMSYLRSLAHKANLSDEWTAIQAHYGVSRSKASKRFGDAASVSEVIDALTDTDAATTVYDEADRREARA